MRSQRSFFDEEEEEEDEPREPGEQRERCTPELLEPFIRKSLDVTGRFPTLREIKHEFGGLWDAYVASWELMRRGTWDELKKLRVWRKR